MADNLTDTAENAALNWTLGNASTGPTGDIKVALVTVAGSDSAPGTEVTGGSYARLTADFAAASGGATSNEADLVWEDMPAATVVGVELWDSAGSPVRWWYGPLTDSEGDPAPKTLDAGDDFKIAAGSLTITLG
ncbi:hypothetical protein [Streptomyces sp. STCH 565 A]|uniref:phage tail fiber protein n=1 Tax=Streptomyces sp. STCH 565 A TaxID=2950532 RepID=UPI002075F6A1|nr:hypothetical protein [Streptomyces sp. STCH 565 A]MCM8548905.1 hypothetical protein [Streptomyces sp. STCH 565 A]